MMTRTRTALLLLALALLAAVAQAFLPLAPTMRVGANTNAQRSKSVGILNSMRENINSQPNPNQVRVWARDGWAGLDWGGAGRTGSNGF